MVYLIPIVVDMAVIFNEKSNHNVKLNWDVNDIHFWNNKYNHLEEDVMCK